jgi:hypothetical protein
VLGEVLHDKGCLGEYNWLAASRGFDGDDRRLAEGVDLGQLGRSQLVLVAMIDLQFIRDLEQFEQKEDALCSRSVEPRGPLALRIRGQV